MTTLGIAARAKRWVAAAAAVGILLLQALLGTPAMAQGCNQAPTPDVPGSGSIVGQIDPPTIGHGDPGSAYDTVAYAGLKWYTYGNSGLCSLSNPAASADTTVGNLLFNVGKSITALTNGLHYLMADGGTLAQFDQFVATGTHVLYNAVFTPYVAVALVLVAIAILYWTLHGDLARIGRKTLWILAGLWLAAATYLAPLLYTHLSDSFLILGTTDVQSNILRQTGLPNTTEANSVPTLLHDQTVWIPWLQGEFGSETSPQAQQYGRELMLAQACSKTEVLLASNPPSNANPASECGTQANTAAKQQQYNDVATALANTPADTYFTGAAGNRTGAGASSVFKALCYDLFPLVSELGILLAQIIIRVVVLGGPLLGLLAILNNSVMPSVFRSIGNALGQGLILAVASAMDTFALQWFLDPQRDLPVLAQIMVMTLITVVLWITVRPDRRVTQMAESGLGIAMPNWAQWRMRRAMRRGYRRFGGAGRRAFGRIDSWVGDRAERLAGDPGGEPSWDDDAADEFDDDSAEDEPQGIRGGRVRPEAGGEQVPGDGRRGRPDEARRPSRTSTGQHDQPAEPPTQARHADTGRHGADPGAMPSQQSPQRTPQPRPRPRTEGGDTGEGRRQEPAQPQWLERDHPGTSSGDLEQRPVYPSVVEDDERYQVWRPDGTIRQGQRPEEAQRPDERDFEE